MKISNRRKMIIAAVVVLAVAYFQYVYSNRTAPASTLTTTSDRYRLTETGAGVSYDFNSQASFYSYDDKGFYFCTKDGMEYLSSDGKVKWSSIFSLMSPIMVGECGIVAVSEPNGRNIYVFDRNGKLYELNYDEPVLSFSVNKAGWLTVILKHGSDYNVLVYQKTGGDPVLDWNYHDKSVFPVSAALSGDCRIVAISFMDIGVSMDSKLVFMYVNETEARDWEDGIFAGKRKEGEIIGVIKFMENNNLIAVSDKGIYSYAVEGGTSVTDKWSLSLSNKIDCLDFYGDKSLAIALGDELLNQEGKPPGTVLFYNTSGISTGQFSTGKKVTFLRTGHDGAVIGQNRHFYAVNNRGDLLWEYNGSQDIKQLIFLDNKDTILLSTANGGNVMKRTKIRDNQRNANEADTESGAGDIFEDNPEPGSWSTFEDGTASGSRDSYDGGAEPGSGDSFEGGAEPGLGDSLEGGTEPGLGDPLEGGMEPGLGDSLENNTDTGAETPLENNTDTGAETPLEDSTAP